MGDTEYYAGIGSRKTPRDILELMTKIGRAFYSAHWILRSGGAEGADSAFHTNVPPDGRQLFLPWPRFNGVESEWDDPAPWTFPIAFVLVNIGVLFFKGDREGLRARFLQLRNK